MVNTNWGLVLILVIIFPRKDEDILKHRAYGSIFALNSRYAVLHRPYEIDEDGGCYNPVFRLSVFRTSLL